MSDPEFKIPGLDDVDWGNPDCPAYAALKADIAPWLQELDDAMSPELREHLDDARRLAAIGPTNEYVIGTATKMFADAQASDGGSLAA